MNEADFEDIMRIQRMMASRIVEERKMDHKVNLLNIINQLLEGKSRIPVEAVILEGEIEGMESNEVERLLEELVKDSLITKQAGFIRKGY